MILPPPDVLAELSASIEALTRARPEPEPEYAPEDTDYGRAFERAVAKAFAKARARITLSDVRRVVERSGLSQQRSLPPDIEAAILDGLMALDLAKLDLDAGVVVRAFADAYAAGLFRGAQEIKRAFYELGRVPTPVVSMAFHLDNPDALAALAERNLAMVKQLDAGTRTYMLDAFRAAFNEHGPGSTDELVRAIYENLTSEERGVFGRKRIGNIVRTEMNAVHSAGRMAQMERAGFTRKRWNAVPALACPICMGNQAKGAIPMGETFNSVFGPVQHPPGHPSVCHCHLSIDLAEAEEIAAEADDDWELDLWDGGDE